MATFKLIKFSAQFFLFLNLIHHPILRSGGDSDFGSSIMLGKVRASPMSSLELLEMERPPPKMVKHDSLSIYESTLLKLKQGSRCNQEDYAPVDTSCVVTDSCSPGSSFPSLNCNIQSTETKWGQSKSIIYLFSKYKSSQQLQRMDRDCSCSVSPSSSG